MHHMDRQAVFPAQPAQLLRELFKRDAAAGYLCQHNHGEHILQHRLGDVYNIHIIFGAHTRHLGQYAHHIFSDHCNNRSHCLPLHLSVIGFATIVTYFIVCAKYKFKIIDFKWKICYDINNYFL